MGQVYTNPYPSPAPTDEKAIFYWRDDIREYDTVPFRAELVGFPFYYEDLDLLMTELRYLSTFDARCQPSMLISVLAVLVLNIAPIAAYIYWSIVSEGKYLWTLSLVPIYLALNALLPLLFNKIQTCLMKSAKENRAREFNQVLAKFNDRSFQGRGYRARYNQDDFVLVVGK